MPHSIDDETRLIGLLRRWICLNGSCKHEHHGPPDDGCSWRWCPACKTASARTHACIPVLGNDAIASRLVVIPKHPSRGKLASMALRYDHAIFAPTQAIEGMVSESGEPFVFPGRSKTEIISTLSTMSQLHEEVTLQGFYHPANESAYRILINTAMSSSDK